ncbi:MAG TPA: tripartite tricarboxylate transporter substrate-binding protein [Burkholderiales bacterium]|nr:tripartite tricarboxylate transporter substrate-binding protein [Burkholderiales bacterium]
MRFRSTSQQARTGGRLRGAGLEIDRDHGLGETSVHLIWPLSDRNMRCAWLIRFVLACAAAGSVPPDARAQVTFARPVRLFVPVAAGGTTDLTARLVADGIRESLGQPVVVENRPGASGRIAAEALKHAAADGTTFLLAPIVVSVLAPLVFRDLSYDPSKDFAPVAQVARYPFVLAVRPDHPARTVPEFVAWAKANPRQASFGTAGSGGVPHLLGTMVGRATGTDLVHVSYRSVAQIESELIGGQIPAAISAFGDFLALDRAGRLRIIATSGTMRAPLLPAVPTFVEQGFPSVVAIGWNAVYAPAGTPKPLIDHLSIAIVKALRTPTIRNKLMDLGLEPTGTTPDELAAIIAADTAHWAPIVRAAGFAADGR